MFSNPSRSMVGPSRCCWRASAARVRAGIGGRRQQPPGSVRLRTGRDVVVVQVPASRRGRQEASGGRRDGGVGRQCRLELRDVELSHRLLHRRRARHRVELPVGGEHLVRSRDRHVGGRESHNLVPYRGQHRANEGDFRAVQTCQLMFDGRREAGARVDVRDVRHQEDGDEREQGEGNHQLGLNAEGRARGHWRPMVPEARRARSRIGTGRGRGSDTRPRPRAGPAITSQGRPPAWRARRAPP